MLPFSRSARVWHSLCYVQQIKVGSKETRHTPFTTFPSLICSLGKPNTLSSLKQMINVTTNEKAHASYALGTAVAVISIGMGIFTGVEAHARETKVITSSIPLSFSSTSRFNPRNHWEIQQELGSGAYGVVKLAKCVETGEVGAAKILDVAQVGQECVFREIEALQRIQSLGGHQNIIHLKDITTSEGKPCLVTEFVSGGELFAYIKEHGVLSEMTATKIIRDIANALQFMHSIGLIHNDLKPENLLLCNDSSGNVVKLADFGSSGPPSFYSSNNLFGNYRKNKSSCCCNGSSSSSNNSCSGSCSCSPSFHLSNPAVLGTTAYWSPELGRHGKISSASDMWAVGCILYILLFGKHPFDLEGIATDEEVEQSIEKGIITFEPSLTLNISPLAIDVITQLLQYNPDKRMTAQELLQHPWLKSIHG